MSAWFAAKCPLDTWEKTWVETWMRSLAEQFGIQRLLRAELVLPTEQYFPEPYHGTPEDAQRILDRLCYYVGIAPGEFSLDVCEETRQPRAATPLPEATDPSAGDGPKTLSVTESQLEAPQRLIALLTRVLAQELLVGSGLLTREDPEQETATDLLAVYLGLGVLAANATTQGEYWTLAHGSWSRIQKQGYLPSRMLGYALALFAFMRHERKTVWARHLRPDARDAFQAGLRWLRETKDSLFHPDTIRRGYRPPSAHEAAERLRSGSPTVRMATLWEIGGRRAGSAGQGEHAAAPAGRPGPTGLQSPGLLAAVMECLKDPDPTIPAEAARALAVFGPAAETAVPGLVHALKAHNDRTQAGAAYALGMLGLHPQVVIPELQFLLGLGNRTLASVAAAALGRFGPQAEPAIGDLLEAFTTALIDCDRGVDVVAQALLAITPEPERHVEEYFEDGDPELRQLALDALDDNRELDEE